jgi:hypothetical protein
MLNDLQVLAEKTNTLAGIVNQLRKENASLRQELASLSAAQRELNTRVQAATQRIETLLEQLPQD